MCGSLSHHIPIIPLFLEIGESAHNNYCLQVEEERKKEDGKKKTGATIGRFRFRKKELKKETEQLKSRQGYFLLP